MLSAMPCTALDPNTALVVIDLQRGILALPIVHPAPDVLARSVRLVNAFRAQRRPVVLVRVAWSADGGDALSPRCDAPTPARTLPSDFATYADELHADPARDMLITKRQWGAFYGTELDLQLRRRGVTGIVLCGISTSIGVESTARAAFELGYNLTFASDAMTDLSLDAHDRALRIIFPRMGETDTTDAILTHLALRQAQGDTGASTRSG